MTLQEQIDLLGWKDITTDKQIRNGTRIYRLPIKMYGQYIEVGSFESGYVRRMNGGFTPYQLNKCEPTEEYFKEYKWCETRDEQYFTGKYKRYVGKRRIPIMSTKKRLQHLITYCLKNYYIKQANQVEDGKFVPKWKYENLKDRTKYNGSFLKCEDTDCMTHFKYSGGQIENMENGDIFVHEQHAYWNHRNDGALDNLSVTVNGERYKII